MYNISSLTKAFEQVSPHKPIGDFLQTQDKSYDVLSAILLVAQILKTMHKEQKNARLFDSGSAVSIFKDNSTRTRFSYAFAANLLGLNVVDLDEQKSQIAHGETARETAVMTSFLAKAIGIRDDMFIGQGNSYMRDFGSALDESYDAGVLNHRPSIINLQCDIDHPTQSMSDLLHLKNTFGSLENLKGKKLAMSWAYSPSYGKPLSVPQGIITLLTRFGMNVVLAHPKGYELMPECLNNAKQNLQNSGGAFEVVNDMNTSFENADIVYPKSWAPFAVMQKRTDLLGAGDNLGLKSLESECLVQNAKHQNWECNESTMALTRNKNALYMHCLPADITGVSCEKGEVQNSVFEKYRLQTYAEASYKPFVIAAMIMLGQCKNTTEFLLKKLARS